MALDATILNVTRDGADVVLTLGPRIDDADKLSIAGQSKLRIKDATWEPPVGVDLWGSSQVEILTKPSRWYQRDGYTTLYEAFR